MNKLLNNTPIMESNKNFTYWKATAGSLLSKVHSRLKIKLVVAAEKNPNVFDTYLFHLIFSFTRKVTPKSTSMPEAPTIPNLRILKSSGYDAKKLFIQ